MKLKHIKSGQQSGQTTKTGDPEPNKWIKIS